MKRTIALLLALIMMFSLAVPVLAEEGSGEVSPEPTAVPEDEAQDIDPGSVTTPVPEEEAPEATETPAPEATEEPEPVEPTPDPAEPSPSPEAAEPTPDLAEPSPSPEAEPSPSPEAEEPEGDPFMLLSVIPEATSELELSITTAMDIGTWAPVFSATLEGLDGIHFADNIQSNGDKQVFKGLSKDTYTLTVSGQGFAAFTQQVQLGESDGALIQLTVGQRAGYGAAHPGVLLVGDVTGDGRLDEADKTAMMEAVAQTVTTAAGERAPTDLNGDGVTNLVDAEYLAKSIKSQNAGPVLATEEHFVPAAAISEIAPDTNTQITGDATSLFQDDSQGITIAPIDETKTISPEEPVAVGFSLAAGAMTDQILIENTNISAGVILITCDDGNGGETFVEGFIGAAEQAGAVMAAAPGGAVERVTVKPDGRGGYEVNLGPQRAVKRVTITITGTSDSTNLASITHVEFVNGMEDRIPEPKMDIPADVSTKAGSREFTVTWAPAENVTGYEVEISAGDVTEVIPTNTTTLTVTNFNNDEVLNYTTYTVKVQSVNGTWKSGWSEAKEVTPKPTGKPDKPDNVKAVGGYQTVTVSWKNMKDTERYNLYYKAAGEQSFTQIPDLKVTSYVISGLNSDVETEYEVYVTGVNEFGESAESIHASAKTTTLNPPEMPRFNLINREDDGTPSAKHIQTAVLPNTSGIMMSSPLDTGTGTAWGTVDGDPKSYYERATWNDGGWWNMGSDVGLIYTFDQAYEMDTIGIMSTEANMDYTYVRIRWWDANGEAHLYEDSVMRSESRKDSQGRTYFFLRMPDPITTSKIQIGVARYWAGNNRIAVSDVYFYRYDDLKRQLNDLYSDDLHTTLKEGVTEKQLNDIKAAIQASVDQFGNVNPDKDQLLKEWDTAWDIFNAQFLSKVTQVHTGITANSDEHGFGGLNAWQPLGVTAAAGEKITVYVGSNLKKTGENTNLQLVFTQYHAESSAMSGTLRQALKVGANEITVPKISTSTGYEAGGALYVQYTGGTPTVDEYAVRVNGGVDVPVLDLYKVTDTEERSARVSAYVTALKGYVNDILANHKKYHQDAEPALSEVSYEFDNMNCILGATDIMLDTMMLSLPAQQVLEGCGSDASKLLKSLDAMESMMYLFYQHKGLNASAKDVVDQIPRRHLNIRYQRMFSGAFMYASGDHIGIEWPETAGMAGCAGVTADASGRYQSGNYFGWGVAHEIGHDINQGTYAIAEITNNYFAVLAQANETNEGVRFEYPKVYEKVTSGTKGRAGNVFTQLGMYWQLHLAYDKGYNFKTYADYDEQLDNLFWARVDTYARTPSKAPGELVLKDVDMEQALMRLCCAAAEKDILDFFQRWGKTPDADTVAYASQFDEETRAIYYVCDDSRRYTLEKGGASVLAADGTTAAIDSAAAVKNGEQSNTVTITVTPNGKVPAEEILGYEIVRCTIAGGVPEKKTVGFTTTNTFTDTVYAMNNRTVSYEVTLVDKYLNRSAVVSTDMVKIQHEGILAKDHWTVSTTGLSAEPIRIGGDSADDPEVIEEAAATLLIDGKDETVYTGTVELKEGETAAIEIDFHENQTVTGFLCKTGGAPLGGYTVQLRQNGEWSEVATYALDEKVYFSNAQGAYVSTYSADAMRLTLTQTSGTVTIAELSVMGPSGDNVDFHRADGQTSIGYLSADYHYGDEPEDVIRAGSLVFTGSYKGNAAYNVVVLYDQNGNVVTGGTAADGTMKAYQVILSEVPENGDIQDVAEGAWVYWIDVGDLAGFISPTKVRVELYRVNNAQTNEGERLVSDSLFVDVPPEPGQITISGGAVG